MGKLRVLFIAVVIIAATITARAQTVDEIVTRHVDAIGGKDAWKKVNSLSIDGILNAQGIDIKISLVQLHGKGIRQDILLQGMAGYKIVTPTQGWIFMPFHGQTEVAAMSGEDVKQAQNELDTHGSLVDYKAKGHTAELSGKEIIDGEECYKIILTLNSGKKETLFIDLKNYYVIRTIVKQKMNGLEEDMQTNFSGFEKISEGIVVAKSLTLPYGVMTLTKVEINKAVNENVFSPVYNKESDEPR